MRKKLENRKGFTLIELLAVIIILAILMTLAITSMSGYIRKAKKDTFVTTAQQYANSVRLSVVNGEYEAPAQGSCIAIGFAGVELESGSNKSSFDKEFDLAKSFMIVHNTGTGDQDKYVYYVQMLDKGDNGFSLIEEGTLGSQKGKAVREKGVNLTPVSLATVGANQTLSGSTTCKLQSINGMS